MQSYEYLYNTEAVRKTGFKKKRCLDMNMKNYNKFMCCFLIQIHLQSVEWVPAELLSKQKIVLLNYARLKSGV